MFRGYKGVTEACASSVDKLNTDMDLTKVYYFGHFEIAMMFITMMYKFLVFLQRVSRVGS